MNRRWRRILAQQRARTLCGRPLHVQLRNAEGRIGEPWCMVNVEQPHTLHQHQTDDLGYWEWTEQGGVYTFGNQQTRPVPW